MSFSRFQSSRTITSEQHLGSSSSSDATEWIEELLPQNARNMIVLHKTSSCCCTSPWIFASNCSPSLPTAAPYKSSVCARCTIRLICLQDSATDNRTRSRSLRSARFQHSISRYRWKVLRFFFLGLKMAGGLGPDDIRSWWEEKGREDCNILCVPYSRLLFDVLLMERHP